MPILENLLGIDNQAELARVEEKTTKICAKELVEKHIIDNFEVGTFKGLSQIYTTYSKITILSLEKSEVLI